MLEDCANGGKVVRLVQRGQRNQTLELTHGVDIDAEWDAVFHSAMYNPMTDGDNLAADEQCVSGLYDLPGCCRVVKALGRPRLFGNSGARGVADFEARLQSNAFNLATKEQLLVVRRKQCEFDAG